MKWMPRQSKLKHLHFKKGERGREGRKTGKGKERKGKRGKERKGEERRGEKKRGEESQSLHSEDSKGGGKETDQLGTLGPSNQTALYSLVFLLPHLYPIVGVEDVSRLKMSISRDKNTPAKSCSLYTKDQEKGSLANQKAFIQYSPPAKHNRKILWPHYHLLQQRPGGEPRLPPLAG